MSKAVMKVVAKKASRPEFEYPMSGLRLRIGRPDAPHRCYDERHVSGADPDVAERRVSHLIDLTAEAAVRAIEELDRACDAVGNGDPTEEVWGDA